MLKMGWIISSYTVKQAAFDLQQKETGSKTVAIATSKYASCGAFLSVQRDRQIPIVLHHYLQTYSLFCVLTSILTLFRLGLGFFGQSVTGGGGGGGLLWPPLCISGTNNARVMKFTHNDHLHLVLTCHALWWRHSDVIFRFFNVSYYFST